MVKDKDERNGKVVDFSKAVKASNFMVTLETQQDDEKQQICARYVFHEDEGQQVRLLLRSPVGWGWDIASAMATARGLVEIQIGHILHQATEDYFRVAQGFKIRLTERSQNITGRLHLSLYTKPRSLRDQVRFGTGDEPHHTSLFIAGYSLYKVGTPHIYMTFAPEHPMPLIEALRDGQRHFLSRFSDTLAQAESMVFRAVPEPLPVPETVEPKDIGMVAVDGDEPPPKGAA